jgi:crotonobetaine/carnitine-CoA ligase
MTTHTVLSLLEEQVKKYPDSVFLDGENPLTYASFFESVQNIAGWFSAQNIQKGTHVAIVLPNRSAYVLAWFALARLGAVMVAVNPTLNAEEMGYILHHSDAVMAVVCDETKKTTDEAIKQYAPSITTIHEKDIIAHAQKKAVPPTIAIDPTDPLAILYTSGTTGKPKGVVLSHNSYVIGGQSFALRAQLTQNDRVLVMLPLFHVNAQVYSVMGALSSGAALVFSAGFSAAHFWKEIVTQRITEVNVLGVVANILLKQPQKEEETSHTLRVVFGAGLSAHTIEAFHERFHVPLLETYGLTECPMGTSNLLDDQNPGSIGKPSKHPDSSIKTEVRIVDDNGVDCAVGEQGEIYLKSPVLFTEYYKNPEETAKVMKDGWFASGDYGKQDKQGWVYFVDRKKDIIRKRGENLSSKEIEVVLAAMPEIQEVAVVPVPALLGDDDIYACVVLKDGAHVTRYQIRAFCLSRLSPLKMPDYIEIISALPKTPTQKIAKHQLKAEVRERLHPPKKALAYILDGIRTPFGKAGGGLSQVRPDKLAAACLNHLAAKHPEIHPDDVVIGCANQAGEDGKNVARQAVLLSKLPETTPAVTVNRLSASGLEAVRQGALAIASGTVHAVMAGGVESVSRAPFLLPRKNMKEADEDAKRVDSAIGQRFLHPSLVNTQHPVGEAAETLLAPYHLTRKQLDDYAFLSNSRAITRAQDRQTEILPELTGTLTADEIPRPDLQRERLDQLSPLPGLQMTTAGNASKLSDGAAMLLLTDEMTAQAHKNLPSVRILGTKVIATSPDEYGIAPAYAAYELLNDLHLTVDHCGVLEIHEAYAVQILACLAFLRVKPNRVNAYGGAISLGHPFGATGARMVLSAMNQLQKTKEQYALIAVCIGGGQGMAMVLERV